MIGPGLRLLLVAVLVGAPTLARGAEGPPASAAPTATPTSPAVKAEARERFDRGVRLFEKGENAGALAEFKRTYELIPNPLVLFNMGLVYAAMNRPIEASDALQDFLASGGASLSAEQRRKAEHVRAEQAARIAQIVVLTDSPATIEIDGIEAGRTPLAKPLRVASGAHIVAALAPGFLPTRKELTLAGQVTETVVLTLTPTEARMAQLVVRASLPGAEVTVNGKRIGVTPLPASVGVQPGTVLVELRRAGYRAASQSVSLDDGARGELVFRLDEDPAAPSSLRGRLVVSSLDPGAEVLVDGQPRAAAGGSIPLVVGPHLVRVQRLGYEPFEQTVDVAAERETPLVAMLQPTSETQSQKQEAARTRRIAGWSLVAGGAVLAVAAGVYATISQGDVSSAKDDLSVVLAHEAQKGNLCDITNQAYMARGCDNIKATAYGRVDDTTLHRNLGLAGAGVGLVVAGVGSYLLLSGGGREATARRAGPTLAGGAWSDGRGGGLLLSGRF
jgi:hypothetical protein